MTERTLRCGFKPPRNGFREIGTYSRTNFAFSRHGNLLVGVDNDSRIKLWPRDAMGNEFEITVNGEHLTFERSNKYLFQCRPGQDVYRRVMGLEVPAGHCAICGKKVLE